MLNLNEHGIQFEQISQEWVIKLVFLAFLYYFALGIS